MSEVMTEKKYKLTRKELGKLQPCIFLKRPGGCRNGGKCPFSHGTAADKPGLNDELPPPLPELRKGNTTGVVKVSPSITRGKQKTKKRGLKEEKPNSKIHDKMEKKRTSEIINDGGCHDLKSKNKPCFAFQHGNCSKGDKCQFAHEHSSQQQRQQQQQMRSMRLSDGEHSPTSIVTGNNATACEGLPIPMGGSNNSLASILSGLPVSPFPAEREKKRARYSMGGGSKPQSRDPTCSPPPPPIPEPIHSFADAWDSLVALTCSHPMYSKYFVNEYGANDRVWVPICGERCRDNSRESTCLPQVLALDCEMCMVEDPKSGIRNGKELLRLSVVDGRPQRKGKKGKLEPRVTLVDTLVKPLYPIVQMRSAIHGIIETDLENVEFTKDHGQAALLKLSCPRTVIVGHAVHNDLDALMLNHARVVDTSLLFGVKDEPGAVPSLRDVSQALLGTAIQDGIHDSVMDASIALAVAEKALELITTGKPLPDVERLPRNKRGLYDSLLVHRIPRDVKQDSVQELFMMKTTIVPVDFEIFEETSGTKFWKMLVLFQSPAHANLAFDCLEGESRPDKANKLQKRVYTKSGSYIQVRKMVREKTAEDPSTPQNRGAYLDSTEATKCPVPVDEQPRQTDIWK